MQKGLPTGLPRLGVVALVAVLSLGTEECDLVPEECWGEGACVVVRPGEAIHIGVGAPLSPPYATYGIDVSRAVEIALGDAGALWGRGLEMDAQDDYGSPEGGESVAQGFVADGSIVAVVGHMFSGATQGALLTYEDARIPIVSPASTRIDLSQQGFDVFNRVIASDLFQADKIAQALIDMNATKLAIVHDGTSFGQALAERLEQLFVQGGGSIAIVQTIDPGMSDYSGELATVADAGPDSVFFGGYGHDLSVILPQRPESLEGIPWVGPDAIYGSAIIEAAGESAEDLYATSPSAPEESAAKIAFDAAYLEANGEAPTTPYSYFAYDAANIIIAAIEREAIPRRCALFIPREAVIEGIRATSGYQGITGEITCDATGECQQGGYVLFQVQDGAWVEVP